jgi:hypothetical protein
MELFDRRVFREGIAAGLIGAATVAAWFLAFDAIKGHPFHTPALIGSVVFQGLRDPQALQVTPGLVLGYTAVHLFAFAAFGVLCAALIATAGRHTILLLASIGLLACFQLFLLAIAGLAARLLLGALLWWEIFVANVLASLAMLSYFFAGQRALGRSLLTTLGGVIREGMVAGLIGAGTVAVWFLIFDTITRRPLRTPGLLGTALFEGLTDPRALQVSSGAVLGYTLLHVLAFAAFGILCAVLISASEREPSLLWAFLVLFACFQALFLALAGLLGQSMVDALVWWATLAGNVLASIGMLAYFSMGHRALRRTLLGTWIAPVREGIAAGLIGAGTVAFWFLAYDLFRGHPLRTPALLGAVVFGTGADPQAIPIDFATILGYTVLHCLAFTLFGILASFMILAAERQPILLIGLFMLFAAFEVLFFGFAMIFAQSIVGALTWWTIFIGNLLASAAMLGYFFLGHRRLRRRLTEAWPAEDDS